MIDVWARRANSEQAQAFVETLRERGESARECNAQWFDPDQIDGNVTRAYHDGGRRGISEAYEAIGLPCELIPGMEASRVEDLPSADNYEIIERGPWFTVIGPSGKVGKSQRSYEDAETLIEEVRRGDD